MTQGHAQIDQKTITQVSQALSAQQLPHDHRQAREQRNPEMLGLEGTGRDRTDCATPIIQPPALLPVESVCAWPNLPEVSKAKQDAFIQHVRYALFRGKPFDSTQHPDAS